MAARPSARTAGPWISHIASFRPCVFTATARGELRGQKAPADPLESQWMLPVCGGRWRPGGPSSRAGPVHSAPAAVPACGVACGQAHGQERHGQLKSEPISVGDNASLMEVAQSALGRRILVPAAGQEAGGRRCLPLLRPHCGCKRARRGGAGSTSEASGAGPSAGPCPAGLARPWAPPGALARGRWAPWGDVLLACFLFSCVLCESVGGAGPVGLGMSYFGLVAAFKMSADVWARLVACGSMASVVRYSSTCRLSTQ